jgi:hypothetical protein
MKLRTTAIIALVLLSFSVSIAQEIQMKLDKDLQKAPSVLLEEQELLSAPEEGLWSIATGWEDDWPSDWHHASPAELKTSGDWQVVTGELDLPQGKWILREAYKPENGMIKCIRRFEWTGEKSLEQVTLSVRWKVEGEQLQAFFPGILFYGNPSGAKNRPQHNPRYNGTPGEKAIFEDHRYPLPFACLESDQGKFGTALHSIPSPIRGAVMQDQWWSMGAEAYEDYSELVMYSGPITYNGQNSVAKALQSKAMKYGNTYLKVEPGTIIEKTYYIDLYSISEKGTAFQKPIYNSIDIFKPFYAEDLPTYQEIIIEKYRFAQSRWIESEKYAGFNMYPEFSDPKIVMGWCGQAASLGFALQYLQKYYNDETINDKIQRSLDFVSGCPVSDDGFPVRYNLDADNWTRPDHVSQGQGLYNIAKAIEAGRKNDKLDSRKWEEFLKAACDVHAERILEDEWYPRSTAEGFYIAPLAIASKLFNTEKYKEAALKAANHYAERHLSMEEPYWGGTLDARGEDKEGAWAGFQGFLAAYELTGEQKYLDWAKHACDVCLSYVVVWDIPVPPGRMADHNFKTRGWTVVSPQNQHIDVYGVFFTPEIYKMGVLLNNESLKRLAKVMYRSCGQLIDPFGSQGEQLQQTNFAQHGNMSDVLKLRGGYSEPWTVFWITAHFLNAAARFEEMGVDM